MQRYKYGGRDDSLMLKYITTPLYDRIMEYIPLWVAPNVITLSGTCLRMLFAVPGNDMPYSAGLAWFLVSYLVSLYYCPLLEGGISPRVVRIRMTCTDMCYVGFATTRSCSVVDLHAARRCNSRRPGLAHTILRQCFCV